MSRNEMRAIRREIINSLLRENYLLRKYSKLSIPVHQIKSRVREWEYVNFGFELKAYKGGK